MKKPGKAACFVSLYLRVCVCVCVCVLSNTHTHTHTPLLELTRITRPNSHDILTTQRNKHARQEHQTQSKIYVTSDMANI